MDEISEIYGKYCICRKLIDFPISGNYTREKFPDGVATLLRNTIYKTGLIKKDNKAIIMAIGSGNINNDTNCEQYTILYVPLSHVPDVLTMMYDDPYIESIYSELTDMLSYSNIFERSSVFAVTLQYDYTCIFQMKL
jgi:hypothetical protein